jgi:sugar (pentulose or hexulose) kinase
MFPIADGDFDPAMLDKFDDLDADRGYPWKIREILPQVLKAGEAAGELTSEGARLLDPSGTLRPGALFCPPEGDAATGMVATNSVAPRTGNVSVGTSVFAMVVLEHELSKVYPEIDLVTTPAGDLVAMAHCNNGASELNEWGRAFAEFAAALGSPADTSAVFETLYHKALEADSDAGGLLAYNYLAGETITGLEEGRPLFLRTPDSNFSLGNFFRAQIFGAFATLRLGLDMLQPEGVRMDSMFGHGGVFKTKGVAQRLLAGALNVPVTVGEIAGEGGAWGIAVLAAYALDSAGLPLGDYLTQRVFASATLDTIDPVPEDVAGFAKFLERFTAGLPIEAAAIKAS